MKATIVSTLKTLDQRAAHYKLQAFGEKRALIILLFHSLFSDRAEVHANRIAPQQGITSEQFRRVIAYYLEAGYKIVSPLEVAAGLDPDGKHLLLTFDDGYFNNSRALPALAEYGVPALFFVSTRHVSEQKLFWWDVLHREACRNGKDLREVQQVKNALKLKRTDEIEALIRQQFGEGSLNPTSDTDRPFTESELRDFAREKWVYIGNHTANHAILTNYSLEEVASQIRECQDELSRVTQSAPICISYPNGNHSDEIARIARKEGMLFGITGITGKNYLPISFNGMTEMKLNRMVPYGIYGERTLVDQCASFRTDVHLYGTVKNLFSRLGKRPRSAASAASAARPRDLVATSRA